MQQSGQNSLKELRIFAILTLVLEIIMMVLFCFAKIEMKNIDEEFVQINIFIIIGFGFFMASIKGYSYSSIVLVFFTFVMTIQFNILFFVLWKAIFEEFNFKIDEQLLMRSSCGVVSVLIALGAVFGKTGPIQILILSFVGSLGYTFTKETAEYKIKNSTYILSNLHLYVFGSCYGLITGCFLAKKIKNSQAQERQIQSTYVSDIISIIGALFLWIFWPAFNASNFYMEDKLQLMRSNSIIQTIFSLAGSCLGTYIMCSFLKDKYQVKDLLIGSIIGGVAIAPVSLFMTNIGISLGIGFIISLICVPIYIKVSNPDNSCCGYSDMFGTFSIYGLPAIFGAIPFTILIAVWCPSHDQQKECYSSIFIRLTSKTVSAVFPTIQVAIALGIGILAGVVAGGLMCCVHRVQTDEMYDDNRMMEIKNDEEEAINNQD